VASNLSRAQLTQMRQLWKQDLQTLEAQITGGTPYVARRAGYSYYDKKAKSGHPATVERERVGAYRAPAATNLAERIAKRFKKVLCHDLRYCERSKSEGLALAISVADSLVMVGTMLPVPVTAISVYLVRRGILDRVCKCGKKKKKTRA
jgi:hypothetical protein